MNFKLINYAMLKDKVLKICCQSVYVKKGHSTNKRCFIQISSGEDCQVRSGGHQTGSCKLSFTPFLPIWLPYLGYCQKENKCPVANDVKNAKFPVEPVKIIIIKDTPFSTNGHSQWCASRCFYQRSIFNVLLMLWVNLFWGWGVPYKWMRCLLEILKIKNKDAKVVFCGWGLIFAILKRHQS